jgi:hypothetical protein
MATRVKKSVALTRSIGLIGEIDAFDMMTFDMIAAELRILRSGEGDDLSDFVVSCCDVLFVIVEKENASGCDSTYVDGENSRSLSSCQRFTATQGR